MKIPCLAFVVLLSVLRLPAAGADPSTMMPDEWTEFRLERFALIQADPALAAESKEIDGALAAQAEKVAAAMAKVDPKVAPVLAKVKARVRSDWNQPAAETISAAEWQILRGARAAALAADPSLAAGNQDLLARKQAFDAKVDAALEKADPGLAPMFRQLRLRDAGEP